MEINVALATPLRFISKTHQRRGYKRIMLANSRIAIWWSWKQNENGNL